jgi:hypothetical protein
MESIFVKAAIAATAAAFLAAGAFANEQRVTAKEAEALVKKIEPKSMYCERADDLIVCGGIYKPA